LTGLRFYSGADLVKTGLSLKLFLKYFVSMIAVPGMLILAIGCDGDEYTAPEIGLEYFPMQTGAYQIYSVEKTEYSETNDPVTEEYEMRVEVVDSFPSTVDELTYVIHRSTRNNPNEDWTALDTWSVRGNDREVVVNEGNVPYVKLIFPVREGSKWNGNKYNTQPLDEYELTDLKSSFETMEGTTFDNTLTVVHENDDDIIVFRDQRKEVYALDVGLVYREIVQIHYCVDDFCHGQQIIENGIEYRQTLKAYGKG
jgi:hypothetical protein